MKYPRLSRGIVILYESLLTLDKLTGMIVQCKLSLEWPYYLLVLTGWSVQRNWGTVLGKTILRGERIHVQTDVGGQANSL